MSGVSWVVRGARFRRGVVRSIGLLVSFVLVVTLPSGAVADPGGSVVSGDEPVRVAPVGEVNRAADVVSAGVAAAVSGEPVVVESLTDEFSVTSVNPDGSFTTEESAGPVRFRDDEGEWQDIDLDLGDGGEGELVPASRPLDVSLIEGGPGKRGRGVAVGHPGGGRQVVWQLPLSGDPRVEGNTAVSSGAWPGVDVDAGGDVVDEVDPTG